MGRDSVVIHVDGDDSGFKKALSGIGDIAKKGIAAAMKGLAAIGTGFTAATGAALKFSGELEQNLGGSEAVFNEFADSIQQKADTAFKTMGLSASDYLATANKMGSLFKGAGFEIEESVDMTTAAMQRAADVASIMGIDTAWAMESIAGAAKGNFTMMDNLGVAMNDTTLNAYALEIGLGKTTAQMTNQEKVALAMKMFLDRTSYAAGNYAKENETLAGSLGTAKAALQNFIAGTGDVDDIVDALSNASEVIIKNLGELLPKLVAGLSGIAKKLVPMIPDIIGRLIPPIIEVFEGLVSEVAKIAPKIAEALIEGIEKAVPALKPLTSILKTLVSNLKMVAVTVGTLFAGVQIGKTLQGIVQGLQAAQISLALFSMQANGANLAQAALNGTLTLGETIAALYTRQLTLTQLAQAAMAKAQAALNAVIAANPIALVVAGVAALVAIMYAATTAYTQYIIQHSEVVAATQAIADSAAQAAQKANELSNSFANLHESAVTRVEDAEAEAYANQVLADELFDLSEKTSLTAYEKERMSAIVAELNGSIDGLNLSLNEETGQLNLTEDAVRDLISQKLELAKANAVQELYTEQLKAQYKAETEAAQNAKKLQEARQQLNDVLAQGEERVMRVMGTETKYTAYTAEQQEAINNLQGAIEGYQSALTTSQGAVADAYSGLETLSQITGVQLPSSFESAKEKSQGFFDALVEQTGTAASEASSKGSDFGQGYVNGINAKQPEAYQAGWDLGKQALQGTKDAQNSNSPAKESAKLGRDNGQGYIVGIKSKYKAVNKTGRELAKQAIEGIRVSADDGKTEVQKVLDEMNEELLESEQKYLDESERLKDSKSDADKKYLEKLKDAADNERKIYDALQKDIENSKQAIVNDFNEMTDEAFSAMEDIESAQKSIADKMDEDTTYSTYTLMENGVEQEHYVLGDGGEEARELENYSKLIDKLFAERGELPDQVLEFLSGMDMEEGTNYINAMLNATNEQFGAYIENLQKEAEYADKISKQLTSNQTEELAARLEEEFGKVPEDFFNIGEESAEMYGEGFILQLKNMFAEVRAMMSSEMAAIGGELALVGAGDVTSTSYTDARTTTINVDTDETAYSVYAKLKAHEIYEEHTRKVGG